MRLDPDWRSILKRAWSIRFLTAAAFFAGLTEALPYLSDWLYIPPKVMSFLTIFSVAAAYISRVVSQENLKDK